MTKHRVRWPTRPEDCDGEADMWEPLKEVDLAEFCRLMGMTEEEALVSLGDPPRSVPDATGHDSEEKKDNVQNV